MLKLKPHYHMALFYMCYKFNYNMLTNKKATAQTANPGYLGLKPIFVFYS